LRDIDALARREQPGDTPAAQLCNGQRSGAEADEGDELAGEQLHPARLCQQQGAERPPRELAGDPCDECGKHEHGAEGDGTERCRRSAARGAERLDREQLGASPRSARLGGEHADRGTASTERNGAEGGERHEAATGELDHLGADDTDHDATPSMSWR